MLENLTTDKIKLVEKITLQEFIERLDNKRRAKEEANSDEMILRSVDRVSTRQASLTFSFHHLIL